MPSASDRHAVPSSDDVQGALYCCRVTFRITLHSGFSAPAQALDLLWERLDASRREDARFSRVGAEIRATWKEDAEISMERDQREEIGRRAVFDIVSGICEREPELESDWFAVSTRR